MKTFKLNDDELFAVLSLDNNYPEDQFIEGTIDIDNKCVILYRGNLERLVVEFSYFDQRPLGPKPDFNDFEIIDCGQTLRFGEYEAATDKILYDFDPLSRSRMIANMDVRGIKYER